MLASTCGSRVRLGGGRRRSFPNRASAKPMAGPLVSSSHATILLVRLTVNRPGFARRRRKEDSTMNSFMFGVKRTRFVHRKRSNFASLPCCRTCAWVPRILYWKQRSVSQYRSALWTMSSILLQDSFLNSIHKISRLVIIASRPSY